MKRADKRFPHCRSCMGFLWLILLVTSAGRVWAEHRPDNLADMEPLVWYDLKDRAPYFEKIICDPATPGRMFSGTGALYESTDDGATWTLITEATFDYRFQLFFVNGQVGIIRYSWTIDRLEISLDLGKTWTARTTPVPFNDLDVSIFNGSIVAYYLDEPGSIYSFWKSTDFGQSWVKTFEHNRIKSNDYPLLDHSPYLEGLILATDGLENGGYGTTVYLSRDDGSTWEVLPTDNLWSIKWVSFHPMNLDEFYLMFDKHQWWQFPVRRTRDGGQTWEEFGPDCSEEQKMGECLYADPDDANIFILSNHVRTGLFYVDRGGIYITRNGGTTWKTALFDSNLGGGPTSGNPSQAWKSTTGSGEIFVQLEQLYKLPKSGDYWVPVYPAQISSSDDGLMSGYIGNNQEFVLYAQAKCGLFHSFDEGIHWAPSTVPNRCFHAFTIFDFSCDSDNSKRLYFTAGEDWDEPKCLYSSTDKGVSWERIEYTGPGTLVYAKASSSVPNRVFGFYDTELDERKVAMSDDNGATWIPINTPHPAGLASFIDSHRDPDLWLCTECVDVEGTEWDELWLSVSNDSGVTWTRKSKIHDHAGDCSDYRIYNGLTLYEDPHDENRLYLSQSHVGLFRSKDNGNSWKSLHEHSKGCLNFDIERYSDGTVIWGNERSLDDGQTWCDWREQIEPWHYPPGHLVSSQRSYYLFENRHSRVMRIEKNPPRIEMAGFGMTWISMGTPGHLDILVWVTDPDLNDRVTSIEVFWDGEPLGFKVEEELVEESGLFWIRLPYESLDDPLDKMEFRAKDIWGHLSSPCTFSKLG
ncbi:hypothetical protein JW979_03345 [bacterium]|nr:hypothetical protein [candidate division CSSED10-310 bacterium]